MKSTNEDRRIVHRVAQPTSIDPEILELDRDEVLEYHDCIAGGRSTVWPVSVRDYINVTQEIMTRQANDIFTVDEAAQILADSRPGIKAIEMVQRLRKAVLNNNPIVRRSGDQLPMETGDIFRSNMNVVRGADITAWLEASGAGYRFLVGGNFGSEETAGRLFWEVVTPKKFQGYGEALHAFLCRAHASGKQIPRPTDVVDAWSRQPMEPVTAVEEDGLVLYQNGLGQVVPISDTRAKTLDAIRGAINRMTKRTHPTGRLRQVTGRRR